MRRKFSDEDRVNIEHVIPEEYRWENLASREGIELKEHYQRLFRTWKFRQ